MITRDDLQPVSLLAGLPPEQVDAIAARAADLTLEPDDWLLREGEQAAFFFLLRGSVTVYKNVAGEHREMRTFHAGEYFGEVPLLLGSPAIASLKVNEPSRAARLEVDDFHELILASRALADQLFGVMVQRITQARGAIGDFPPPPFTVVGHRWDRECHELRNFLARNQVAHSWIDLADPVAAARVPGGLPDGTACPVLVRAEDGSRLTRPSYRQAAEHVRLTTRLPAGAAEEVYDVVIVGGGPAGLAAAVYGASEGLGTILIERFAPGGQAGTSSRIENYLGFPAGLSGDELSMRARHQADKFGARLLVARKAERLIPGHSDGSSPHLVGLDGGDTVRGRAVILALGVSWRRHEALQDSHLLGRGVYYGAARTEAQRTQGKHIHLLGGGNSAGQAALWFANYASKVSMLVRGPSLAASMSHYLISQLESRANIERRFRTELTGIEGVEHVEHVKLRHRDTGAEMTEATGGVFILIGADAETDWLPPAILRDRAGYICTGRDVLQAQEEHAQEELRSASWPLRRDPFLLETSVPGIFAAGDVRHGSIKRCASGVGEGSMSIAFVHQYLAG